MRALLLCDVDGHDPKPRPGDTLDPAAGPGEVLVQIEAAGLNHVDLLLATGRLGFRPPLPHTMGIEGAGYITAIGGGVDETRIGQAVTIYPYLGCGQCAHCYAGEEQVCPVGQTTCIGLSTPGTFAERVAVPARNAVALPDGLAPQDAAACTITGMTAYRLVNTKGAVQAGETVLIRAVGSGVGVMAAQLAKAAGAYVIGTAGTLDKLEKATALGVDKVINHDTENVPDRIKTLTEGNGVDLIVDYVGSATWKDNLRCMGRSGRLVLCGAHTGTKVELDLWHLFAKEHAIAGSYGGTRHELSHTLELLQNGQIKPVVDKTTSLNDAVEALNELEARQVFGKLLLQPH